MVTNLLLRGKVEEDCKRSTQAEQIAGVRKLYLSRDGKRLSVTNRGEGSVSVLNADRVADHQGAHLQRGYS